jgi:hypothetical protein
VYREPHAVLRGCARCVVTPGRPFNLGPLKAAPDLERFQRPPGAILAPSARLHRTSQFKAYLGRATLLSNIIHAKMCWLGNRSGTMATGKQLILSGRTAKRPRKKRMRPEPRQYTVADLERARDRVAAAERRIDNDPMSNSRRGRAGLKRAQLELSVIKSQLRSRGLLE